MKLVLDHGKWYVTSDSNTVVKYHVFWSEIIGRWTCECLDWRYRKVCSGVDCKHIDFMMDVLENVIAGQAKEAKKHV
jgi:hypothetical protein